MNTPIADFVKKYALSDSVRFHMPGHKGRGFLDAEQFDITEINGADSLYEADGIICESEKNASELFGCKTFYSAEGSSLCIRAMVYLASLYAKKCGHSRTRILAGRNAHKAFLSAVALADADVEWIYGPEDGSYLACSIDAGELDTRLRESPHRFAAVYVTSPDYLGNICDIKAISQVCRKHGALLISDNAHGAYLKFLPSSRHPIDLGADMCCDSAHKTLSVLTGGAYLHLSDSVCDEFAPLAKDAMALFGSTSPSYLILASLDMANRILADGYRESLKVFVQKINELKNKLKAYGYTLLGGEELKITIDAKKIGYKGHCLANILRQKGIECEFADEDFTVFMLSTFNTQDDLTALESALTSIEPKPAICTKAPKLTPPKKVMSVREAYFACREKLPSEQCEGRVLAAAAVSCPPAAAFIVCGEKISRQTVQLLKYYNKDYCWVVKQ